MKDEGKDNIGKDSEIWKNTRMETSDEGVWNVRDLLSGGLAL